MKRTIKFFLLLMLAVVLPAILRLDYPARFGVKYAWEGAKEGAR